MARGDRKRSLKRDKSQTFAAYVQRSVRATTVLEGLGGRERSPARTASRPIRKLFVAVLLRTLAVRAWSSRLVSRAVDAETTHAAVEQRLQRLPPRASLPSALGLAACQPTPSAVNPPQ
jgi:hypothetical protein